LKFAEIAAQKRHEKWLHTKTKRPKLNWRRMKSAQTWGASLHATAFKGLEFQNSEISQQPHHCSVQVVAGMRCFLRPPRLLKFGSRSMSLGRERPSHVGESVAFPPEKCTLPLSFCEWGCLAKRVLNSTAGPGSRRKQLTNGLPSRVIMLTCCKSKQSSVAIPSGHCTIKYS
jgi:hypothetical protein